MAGCSYVITYPKGATCECKEWIRDAVNNRFNKMTAEEVSRRFPVVGERFNYYMCVNGFFHPQYLRGDVFNSDPQSAARLVASRLATLETDSQLYFAICVLYDLQQYSTYNVAAEGVVMAEIELAYARIKNDTDRYIVGTWIMYMNSTRESKGVQ